MTHTYEQEIVEVNIIKITLSELLCVVKPFSAQTTHRRVNKIFFFHTLSSYISHIYIRCRSFKVYHFQ